MDAVAEALGVVALSKRSGGKQSRNPIQRHGGNPAVFGTLPAELMRHPALTGSGARVALWLWSHTDGWETSCKEIADAIGWKRETVKRGFDNLMETGYLVVQQVRNTATDGLIREVYHRQDERPFTEEETEELSRPIMVSRPAIKGCPKIGHAQELGMDPARKSGTPPARFSGTPPARKSGTTDDNPDDNPDNTSEKNMVALSSGELASSAAGSAGADDGTAEIGSSSGPDDGAAFEMYPDWQPDTSDVEWFDRPLLQVGIAAEIAQFRDYHIGNGTSARSDYEWRETCRAWLSKTIADNARGGDAQSDRLVIQVLDDWGGGVARYPADTRWGLSRHARNVFTHPDLANRDSHLVRRALELWVDKLSDRPDTQPGLLPHLLREVGA